MNNLKVLLGMAASVPVLGGLLIGSAANATDIDSAATGDWELPATWVGAVPALVTDNAFILDGHTVMMDRDQTADTADDTTAGTVQVNAGGILSSWFGNMNTGAFTFNGGTAQSNQRTLQLEATSITVTANGGTWGTQKTQNSKHAWLVSPTMTGTGDLTNYFGAAGQVHEVRVPDLTGYTGNFVLPGSTKKTSTTETSRATIKFPNSIAEADASFGLVLSTGTYDWKETNGGTPALDDGTFYGGYDIRNAATTVWVTSLTVGGFSVPARAGSAYTYAELASMNGGDVANYLRMDGTDGLLGVADTGGAPAEIEITDIVHNGASVDLTWTTRGLPAGGVDIYRGTDLVAWGTPIDTGNTGTSYTDNSPPSPEAFYVLVPTGETP